MRLVMDDGWKIDDGGSGLEVDEEQHAAIVTASYVICHRHGLLYANDYLFLIPNSPSAAQCLPI